MPRTGRPKTLLVLTGDEREQLQRWTRRRSSAQALALRSRIVLACASGLSNQEVAAQVEVSRPTVGKWRARFVELRLDGLGDDPRPGRPASVSAEQVEDVIVTTLESTPTNATHWSRASMAKRSGLSKSTIGRIWRAFELKPHRADSFKLSNDPLFVDKVFDVVGLYLNPPEAAVVLCVDEKSQVQALARSQPAFPMMPGMPEKRTHDYVRHGTTSLFAAFNTADGTVISSMHRRHRTIEFTKFLTKIDTEVPDHLDVHLVCDNYGTHKAPAIRKWLTAHPRFHVHYTPTYSSWLNQVERWFAYLTDDLLRRSDHPDDHRSVQALEADIRAWVKNWNDNPKPFIWTKTAAQILDSIGRLLNELTAQDVSLGSWYWPVPRRLQGRRCERDADSPPEEVHDHDQTIVQHVNQDGRPQAPDAGTVEYIADERRQASLDGYYEQFTTDQLAGIEAVAMDMWEPFANSTRAHLTDAQDKLVFDRYHLMGYLTTAVDTVRNAENRVLWLYSAENLPDRHQDRFAVLRAGDLKTARAWAIKESLRHFWSYQRRGWAAKHLNRWYLWATHSRLKPIIDAAKTLKRHQAGLLSYFAHPITNAGAEGLNSRIQAIRVSARGYRNREHFKTAIYFHLGGLQLHPATP